MNYRKFDILFILSSSSILLGKWSPIKPLKEAFAYGLNGFSLNIFNDEGNKNLYLPAI